MSLPVTAISKLSQQVTSTLLEVRAEIGELKCEFKTLRNNMREPMMATAEALVELQLEEIREDFQKQRDKEKREELLERLVAWAVLTVGQQAKTLKTEFRDGELLRKQSAFRLESLLALATSAIRTQVLFVENLS